MKSNPIGVRFDTELLKELEKATGITTPQKALIFYEGLFRDLGKSPVIQVKDLNKEAEPKGQKLDIAKMVEKNNEKQMSKYDQERRMKKNGF